MADTILWRRLDCPGHDIARLTNRGAHWVLSGTAIFAHNSGPCCLDYLVVCDTAWRTRSAHVNGSIGDTRIEFTVHVDEQQRWYLNDTEVSAVRGCIDVDLSFTPATNTIPIRRLALDIGDASDVRAAWLPFPSLAFEVLPQVYRRTGATTYHYESSGGAFVRELEVNAAGLVTIYPGLWQVEASKEL